MGDAWWNLMGRAVRAAQRVEVLLPTRLFVRGAGQRVVEWRWGETHNNIVWRGQASLARS